MRATLTRIIVSALALIASIATAAEFYVAANGNDSNSGSLERPWRSLAAVSGRAFAPGDTVRFARGENHSGCLVITASGTPEKPLVLTSFGDGPAPRFNNPRFAAHSGRIIDITGSHIVVENLSYSPDGDIAAMVGEPLAADESFGDPQFVNPTAGDYTLKPGSLASKVKMGAYPYPLETPIWKAGITP